MVDKIQNKDCSFKNSGGRRARPELRRSVRFSVYLSEPELEKIRVAAIGEHSLARSRQETARQISEFFRKSALSQPIPFNRSVPPCNIELIKKIGGISNNLNQIARLAHMASHGDSELVRSVCGELLKTLMKIRADLLGG
ncbi:plasmid mobilization protein [Aeromonas rivipollensis]|uniref:plasmid mobilization protein n=1 Tax=Aeromonas rivipollensis TaxID=948519 RepID=UPI0039BC35BF